MKSQQLDYEHTCPTIDRCIATCNDHITDELQRLVERLFPIFDTLPPELNKVAQDAAHDLMWHIECEFEVVRRTNERMREQADEQIKGLCEELEELENEMRNQLIKD